MLGFMVISDGRTDDSFHSFPNQIMEEARPHFTCSSCKELLLKPTVLPCGHVFCFWCCKHSMAKCFESQCPACRNPFHHFPAICIKLHNLFKKLYKAAYIDRLSELKGKEDVAVGWSLMMDDDINELGEVIVPQDEVAVDDVLCDACNKILYRPAVLNCGHVYCEGCVTLPIERMPKCTLEKCRHISGLPKCCHLLDSFLKQQFTAEYEVRKTTIQKNQKLTEKTGSSNEVVAQISDIPFPTRETFIEWWTANRTKLHANVGCDMCGMFPIVGKRFQCKECTRFLAFGFDICEDCHTNPSNGRRFLGIHDEDSHNFVLVKPTVEQEIMARILERRLAPFSAFVLPDY